MKNLITRRDAIKLGTGAAVSAAATPLLSSPVFADAAPNATDEICFMRAVDLLDALRKKQLSAREVMQAHLKQINRVNPKVNAMVTMVPEDELMAQAAAADEALAKGKWLGPLHGLPVGAQRPARNQRNSHHLRLAPSQRQCPRLRLPGGAARERGRCELSSAKPMSRNLVWDRKPSIPSSALPTIRTT